MSTVATTADAIRLTAPLTCPSCGRELTGRWVAGRETVAQQCQCGHVFQATWPGWPVEPEVAVRG